MKNKKSETTVVDLNPREQLALKMLAFRAGVSLPDALRAILQNAAGFTYEANSTNAKVVEAAAEMPVVRGRAA